MTRQQEQAPKLFFTPYEAAALLKWHPATVRRKCLAGEMRFERSSSGKMSHIRVVAIDVYRLAGQPMPDDAQALEESSRRRELVKAVRVKVAELEMLLTELEA